MSIVPDLRLDRLVIELLARLRRFDIANNFDSNIVDPFAAAFEASVFGHETEDSWRKSEIHRQKQKALMNHLGQIQQSIIGCLPGWTSYEAGSDEPDVVGVRGGQRIIAEVKNKHNTMNANSAGETYDKLVGFLQREKYQGFVGVVVQVIGPARYEHWRHFAPGVNRTLRDDIIVMNGRPFYALALDLEQRQPGISVKPTDKIDQWPTWHAIDEVTEQFFQSISRNTGSEVPLWVMQFLEPALGT